MIKCVFTLDYEIYGDGRGSLDLLVYQPARRLKELFLSHDVRFVNFVEAAELAKIDESGTDPAIQLVRNQVRDLFEDGFETGLHLHPQWSNASYNQGEWALDFSEYNLCTLPAARIARIIDDSLLYLRDIVGKPEFTPLSFRAGNWLFQPTQPTAGILAARGIRVDSSVFKGGIQRGRGLDYRPSCRNGYFWRFEADINKPDARGTLVEVPIHVKMVPAWKMLTKKRLGFKFPVGTANQATASWRSRLPDFLRLQYPLKLDFCRMTFAELRQTVDEIISVDRSDIDTLRPIVAIGHTKDLVDLDTVEMFLTYLEKQRIDICTFADLYPSLVSLHSAAGESPSMRS